MAEDSTKKTTTKKTTTKKTTTKKATTKNTSATKKTTAKKPAAKSSAKKTTAKTTTKSTTKSTPKKSSATNRSASKAKAPQKKSATEKAAEAAKQAKAGTTKSNKTKTASKAAKTKDAKKDTTKKSSKVNKKKDSKDIKTTLKGVFTPKKKKAPKLVEPKISKNEARKASKATIVKRISRKTKIMRKRGAWVAVLCVGVALLVIGGFKIAGALEINAGYACKVGDVYTKEADVTKYIENQTYYKQYKKSVSQWSQFLSMYGMTPEKFREQVIKDKFEHEELVRRAAEKEEVTVDEAEVDKHVESFKSKYDTEANYKKALENSGFTEETYRDNVYQTQLEENLIAKVIHVDDPSDDDVKTYLSSSLTKYKDARRSSHILFNAKDKDTAQTVLDQIKAGTLSFEAAVSQYSTDEATKAKAGDVGWDKLESLSTAYTSGLSGLSAGQLCDTLVEDKAGIHIIKCTEKWDTPEKIESLDGVPQDIINDARKEKKKSNEKTELNTWLTTFATDNGIETTIYPMPQNVPYNVDMSKQKSNSSTSSTGSTSSTSTPVENE